MSNESNKALADAINAVGYFPALKDGVAALCKSEGLDYAALARPNKDGSKGGCDGGRVSQAIAARGELKAPEAPKAPKAPEVKGSSHVQSRSGNNDQADSPGTPKGTA